jgi:RimJ/RimL family protein N-acetyltransferase
MFIRTNRLFLRPAWREDASALARLLGQPGVQHELAGSPWLEAMADTDHFLAPMRRGKDARLLIFRRTENGPELIGTAGVGRPLDRAEFGLWLTRAERRRGFAQEAGRAILSLAFEGLKLNSVWAPAFREGAAQRLIARLGFRRPSEDATSALLRSSDWAVPPPCMAA